jgi:formylglycine-generating enzyme required for sulfatase activity
MMKDKIIALLVITAAVLSALPGCNTKPKPESETVPVSGTVPAAQDRGLSITIKDEEGREVARFGDARALVIGQSEYTNDWPRLPGVKDDVRAVESLFKEQGFAVETLENASGPGLRDGIEGFLNRHGRTADTRIVIYYAGHGATLTLAGGNKMGYIVPVGAPLPDRDRAGFLRSALAMNQFQTWAEQYDCKHILFIFDSCFSGTVFSPVRELPPVIKENISLHVRQFITSGDENETVPDKSVFRTQLVAALRDGEADGDRDGYVSGTELGMFLHNTVVNYSNKTQNPQYGKIRNPSLDKGDFIFAVGKSRPAEKEPPGPAPEPHTGGVTVTAHTGKIKVTSEIPGMVLIGGKETGTRIKAQGSVTIANVSAGLTEVAVREDSGALAVRSVLVRRWRTVKALIQRPLPANMVEIPGGTFTRGSPESEPGRDSDEGPQHEVTVGSFYMGRYEVTAGEFRRFVNETGYKTTAETDGGGLVSKGGKWVYDVKYNWKNPGFAQNDTQPAVYVSWYDAVEYCNWRSRAEGLAPAYRIDKSRKDPDNRAPTEHEDVWRNDRIRWTVTWDRAANGYRLPTEAEWEYACRAGTVTRYWSGNEEESLAGKANAADQTMKEKYSGDWTAVNIRDGYAETSPAGRFAPNPWGLYDMHGNVWEWCWDWYGDYPSAAQADPAGPDTGADRVGRGGSWNSYGQYLRSANRSYGAPSDRDDLLGFRLALP